jgi:putative ABC transport system permease protein
MARLDLLGTRLWWRRGASIAVLAVALTATLTAVVGPMYAGAAAESTLRQVLSSAPADETGLHVQADTNVTVDPLAPILRALPAGFSPAYPVAIPTLRIGTRVQGRGDVPPVVSNVVWRPGTCQHVHLVAGRCPRGPNDVMVSARTAVPTWALRLGDRMTVSDLFQDQVTPDSGGAPVAAPGTFRVVGVYTPLDVDDPFWFGHDYFNAHLGSGPIGDGPDTVDDLFVDRSAFDNASAGTPGLVWVDYPLKASAVTRASVPALRRAVAAAQRTFPLTEQPTLTTQLPAVLDRANQARSGLDGGTALVTVQLLLLAWLVLFEVVSASTESRGPEIAIAKLRGLKPWDATLFGLGEPVALVLVAAPLGILGGYVATRELAAAVLLPGVPVHLGLGTWLAAAGALAGGLTATVLATRRTLARPILDQWRRAEEHTDRGRRALVVDGIVTAAAIVGLVALAADGALTAGGASPTNGSPSTLSLLGPALLVLATALVGVRLLPVFGRAAADLTRGTRHLGIFIAVRQVARRATEHRFAVLLAVASGVAVFSVAANDVVRHNETRRAQAEVGADAVVNVQPQAGVDVVTAVAKADPHGTWAMAANAWTPLGGSVGSVIEAVDSTRLARITSTSAADLRGYVPSLTAHTAKSIRFAADAVRIAVDATGRFDRPSLDVSLIDARGAAVVVRGPAVRSGAQSIVIPVPCADGCRLVALAFDRNVLDIQTMTGTWTVTRIETRRAGTWSALDAELTVPHAWRAGRTQTSGHDDVVAGATGVTDTFTAQFGGWPSIELADLPRPLPVVLTPSATVTTDTDPFVTDPLGQQIPLQRVATVPRLPRLLSNGGWADLAAARDQLPAFDQYGRWQVWLGPHAPRDALSRLRAAGLVPGRPDTVAAHVRALRQQGPALALQLFLFASFACSALALAAAALALAAAGRRRSFEMASLLAIGVRRGALLRACVVEQLVLLGTGLLLGVVPGLIGARIALPAVPEYADASPVPLLFSPSSVVVAGFAVALAVVVGSVAIVGGVALLRSAVPARLREAAP